MLYEKSLSHDYFRFYRFAMDASLENCKWDETERYASALEEYTRAEPLSWTTFMIERGRALAMFGRGNRGPTIFETLSRLRDSARSIGCRAVGMNLMPKFGFRLNRERADT